MTSAWDFGTPFIYRVEPYDESYPAGNSFENALQFALDTLGTDSVCGKLVGSDPHAAPEYQGWALLFPLSPGTVLVIGVSPLARAVREQLSNPGGFGGWFPYAPPTTRTPLHLLRELMLPQQYNTLTREGFATIEEVEAVPPDAWTELRNVGPRFVKSLMEAVRTVRNNPSPAQTETQPGYIDRRLESTTGSDHGWQLQVAPDGMSATVQGPANLVVTNLTGATLRLTCGTTSDHDRQVQQIEWTTDLAERVLRGARSTGSTFLRALIDEGGTATAETLRERTGFDALNHATQSLTTSAKRVLTQHLGEYAGHWRHFFTERPHPRSGRGGRVYDYHLPDPPLRYFKEALTRLGR